MESNIFDIEILINVDRSVWVIDKNYPDTPIIKLSIVDFNLIKSGIYKNQENLLRFNGDDYFLPKSIIDKLKVRIKKDKMDIGNLSFSMREFLDKELIDKSDFSILIDNIKHLKNKTDNISVISSIFTKEKYVKHFKKLDDELYKIGLRISDCHLISQTFNNQSDDKNIFKKGIILLKDLIGLNIKDSKFIDERVDSYDVVNYYTDISIDLQKQFEFFYYNSDDRVRKLISDKLSNKVLNLYTISSNELNRFVKKSYKITNPPNIMMFESFMRKM